MEQKGLSGVENAFRILELLVEHGQLGVRQLSTLTGGSVAAVHRSLSTLVVLGYAAQDQGSKKYMATYKLAALGHRVVSQHQFANLTYPHLEQLSARTEESVHLVERAGVNIRYISKVAPSRGIVAMSSYVGLELPMYTTAVGKAILARLPEAEARQIWEESPKAAYTPKTIQTWEQLAAALAEIRRTGVAFDDEEHEAGITCIAVSLPDHTGQPAYALSISAATSRLRGAALEEKLAALRDCRESLLGLLGL